MAMFRWRHFAGEIILWAVRWYCRYGISYRELEEMMSERGVAVDHTTVCDLIARNNRGAGSPTGTRAGSVAATTTHGVLVNPNGRQLPLEPTPELRELVERAAGLGLTRAQIAATIKNPATGKPIHPATLTDHFSEEIEAGQARLITEVGTSLWRLALHGENERERRAACMSAVTRKQPQNVVYRRTYLNAVNRALLH